MVVILETKVREANVDKVSKNCFSDWSFANNIYPKKNSANNNNLNPRGHI